MLKMHTVFGLKKVKKLAVDQVCTSHRLYALIRINGKM